MNAFSPDGGGKHRSTAPRVGRCRGDRGTGPGRRKLTDPDRVAGAMLRPRAGPRAALRGFLGGQRGATTIVAAVAISILVSAFAVLMGIVHKIYIEDRMGRGVRAGARAVSLLATAPANEAALKDVVCKALGRELGEDEGKACACWTVEVEAFETPKALSDDIARGSDAPHGGESADMVLVRLSRPYQDWLSGPDTDTETETPDETEPLDETEPPEETDTDPDTVRCPSAGSEEPGPTWIVVAALARNDRAVTP